MILNADEKLHESGNVRDPGNELETFMQNTGLQDLRSTGCLLTWSNGHVSCKLDRAMANDLWFFEVEQSVAHFDAPSLSDHSPVLVRLGMTLGVRDIPFAIKRSGVKTRSSRP